MSDGRVTGIGGVFLRSADPAGITRWYREMLGVGAPEGQYIWAQDAGPTVFSPFPATSDYFPAAQQVMLNFRVAGLDAMLARLAGHGIQAERRAEWDSPEVGRFARIADPEGRAIELWEEPAAEIG
jgi:predicted enzyme related to lactoylglutathione lyase